MLWQLVLAEFRERTRRYSFLATLMFVFFFGLLVITGKWGIFPSQCRGEYNSAWVGATMALGATAMALMVGFYLIKSSIRRDRVTGVGQILAASSLHNRAYLFAKFLSNVLALLVMVGVLVAAAFLMQLSGTVPLDMQPWKLLAPFLFITVPVIFMVAAMAVLFEAIRPLSGGIGNVAYFFLMPLFLGRTIIDPVAFDLIVADMQAAALAAYPERTREFTMGFVGIAGIDANVYPLFHWNGIDWTMAIVGPRLFYILAAVLIVLAAMLFFDRFDTPEKKQRHKPRAESSVETLPHHTAAPVAGVATLAAVRPHFAFMPQLVAEIQLLLGRLSWRWQIVALGLVVAQLAVPYTILRGYLLPASWIWPLLIWSAMGARERMFNTESLFFSSAHPLGRLLPALWMAGVVITMATGSGALIRAILAGDMVYVSAILTAAFFIPSLALLLGMLSGGSQLFEIIYMFLWYVGPINHIPAFDFMAASGPAAATGPSMVFVAMTAAFLPLIFLLRRRRLGM